MQIKLINIRGPVCCQNLDNFINLILNLKVGNVLTQCTVKTVSAVPFDSSVWDVVDVFTAVSILISF